MDAIGKYEFIIDAYLTDFRGRATLPMIGGFMLQTATKHAEERGFGYTYMTERDKVWVLSRIGIEIYQYPKNDELITINTWVSDVNRLFTERRFSFINQNGEAFGYAKSLWACIDLKSRKPMNILDLDSMNSVINKNEPCPIPDPNKISSANNQELIEKFKIKYSDIDINGHLNSMKYIEHFVDVFDLSLFEEKQISRIDLNYLAEGKFGSEITIFQNQEQQDHSLITKLDMKDNHNSICLSRIIWK